MSWFGKASIKAGADALEVSLRSFPHNPWDGGPNRRDIPRSEVVAGILVAAEGAVDREALIARAYEAIFHSASRPGCSSIRAQAEAVVAALFPTEGEAASGTLAPGDPGFDLVERRPDA